MKPPRRRRTLAAAVLLGGMLAALSVPAASAGPSDPSCGVLVLTAMPLELNPIFRAAAIDHSRTRRVDDRTFYFGTMPGGPVASGGQSPDVDVVLAMTGIGPANAGQASAAAFADLGCSFTGAVFSGVAGSKENIGDVTVPAQWTSDANDPVPSWTPANAGMAGSAAKVTPDRAGLAQDVPVGDAACLCPGVDAATPVHMPQPPKVVIGGNGETSDPFGGHAVPCVPGGGDIAGCEPCVTVDGIAQNAPTFASKAPPLLTDPSFWMALFQPPAQTTDTYEAQDEETAIVAQAAAQNGVPFLGIRAASDGNGDPLHLPGFPAQFFVYRQLAGNNAAAVAVAFLRQWAADGYPTASSRLKKSHPPR